MLDNLVMHIIESKEELLVDSEIILGGYNYVVECINGVSLVEREGQTFFRAVVILNLIETMGCNMEIHDMYRHP